MPPIKFGLNPHYGLGGVVFCRISRWPPWWPSWMSEWNEFSILNLHVTPMPPPSYSLIWLTVPKQMSFQDFQPGHHGDNLGYWNGTNLAILNLHVTPMPPTEVGLNPTYCLGSLVWFEDFQDGHHGELILDIKMDISMLLRCLQVSAQSDIQFGRRCCLKIFKMADMAAILDIGMEWF